MTESSRLTAHGSRLTAHGSRLTACAKLVTLIFAASIISGLTANIALACTAGSVTFDFGPAAVAGAGWPAIGTLSINDSSCDTTITGLPVTGTDPNDFVVAPGSNCINFALRPENSCTFTVTFAATATGARTAILQPTTNNGIQPIISYYYGGGFTMSSQQSNPTNSADLQLTVPDPQASSTPFDTGYAALTLDSGNAPVTWVPILTYQTSGSLPTNPARPSPTPTPFTTGPSPFTLAFGTPLPNASPTPDADFQVAGGKLATTGVYDVGASNDPVGHTYPSWITGFPVPPGLCDASITSELTSEYTNATASWAAGCLGGGNPWPCCTAQGVGSSCTSWNAVCTASGAPWSCCSGPSSGSCAAWNSVCTGVGTPSACCTEAYSGTGYNGTCATPDLFAHVATQESSYQQFTRGDANGVTGLWPDESPSTPAGKYIGLMMVSLVNPWETPMETAWNWLDNSSVAFQKFSGFMGYVSAAENNALSEITIYPGLPYLNQAQLEDTALWQYSGHNPASTDPTKQYFVPVQISETISEWVLNSTVNNGNDYPSQVHGKSLLNRACN